MQVPDRFDHDESAPYQPLLIGGGRIERRGSILRLVIPPTTRRAYTDAQIDDYHGRRRSRFPWRPPVRLKVKARMSHRAADGVGQSQGGQPQAGRPQEPALNDVKGSPLQGTAGFGFWNDPFSLSGGVLAAPNAVWFFYASPPSNMALVPGVPGWGWKAAALNAGRVPALLLAPAALLAIGLTRIPGLGRPVMAAARRAVRAAEALISAPMDDWHTYQIEWRADSAAFWVDGVEILRAPFPPRGPLGFVAWVDNQYAVASPDGKFGFGLVESGEAQWMELDELMVLESSGS